MGLHFLKALLKGKSWHYRGNVQRLFFLYIALQAIIWLKVAVFFFLFGTGVLASSLSRVLSGAASFPQLFDFAFHQSMHVLIFCIAVWFGSHAGRLPLKKSLALMLVAVALHNVAYWFTTPFGAVFNAFDFIGDFAVLSLVILASHWLFVARKKGA